MVSSSHEAMHRIFQEYPGLLSGISEVLGVPLPSPFSVTVMPTDLTENRPVERRVDTLLRLDTEGDDGPLLLAVEAQSRKDPAKPSGWAYYVAYVLNKYGRPPLLLVVCQDRSTAEWAERPVDFAAAGWPSLTVRPLVVGPHNMPVITTTAEARKDLPLATFAAITHGASTDAAAILKALTGALRDAPDGIRFPLIEFVSQGLGTLPAALEWRKLVAVDLSFYTSPISEEIREEGRARGRAEGRAEGEARSVLLVMERRGIDVPDDVRERISTCTDPDTLLEWLGRAVTATSAEEVFGGEARQDGTPGHEDAAPA
ncbi:hypothetical protein [Streptomyces genisteinicus]|uniref:Rpn family recombination-promoting nuclease/putative transposase n=1 Tax=Streptomyces genisteinicus TaxID=2768068 RepID=A0A7H0HW32_9ACTN|nr:hypothetical protein [Streptomyces genisteinicus]QNP64748.1 hypothetical protein IAG43_18735 [Streptomyces genisteinicus]